MQVLVPFNVFYYHNVNRCYIYDMQLNVDFVINDDILIENVLF